MIKKIIATTIALLFPFIAFAQINVNQGGTGKTSFPNHSIIVSDGNTFQRLTASSAPTFNYFYASSTATSTIVWGLNITKGLQLNSGYLFGAGLASCSTEASDKLLWNSVTGQFSCGADQTGAGGTVDGSGLAGMMASWTDGNTIQSTSTIVGGIVHATSTTATSTFGHGISVKQLSTTATSSFAGLRLTSGGLSIDTLTAGLLKSSSNNIIAAIADTDYQVPLTFGDGLTRTVNDVDCDTASGSVFGCLSSTDWTTFDDSVDPARTLTVAGTANQITSSAGAQDLSANRTWTLSLPTLVKFPGTASTTELSVFQDLYIGGTATTTILGDTSTSTFSNSIDVAGIQVSTYQQFDNLTSALIQTGAGGITAEYAGTSCTDQFPRSISALGIATCSDVVAADVDLADLTATNGTLTFSGTYDGQTARTIGLNLGNANSWTALQQFTANASTSAISSNNTFLFGSTKLSTSTSPTLDETGEIAINTTSASSSVMWFDGTDTLAVPAFYPRNFSLSTSTDGGLILKGGATSTKDFGWAHQKMRLVKIVCKSYGANFQFQLSTSTAVGTTQFCLQATTTITTFTHSLWQAEEAMKLFLNATSSTWSSVVFHFRWKYIQ